MPTLRDFEDTMILRLLGMGDPGTGKTGSMAELINCLPRFGIERVIIQDWDDGLDILAAQVKPDQKERVHYETLRDELKATQLGVAVRDPKAYTRGMALMNNWTTKTEDLGPASKWGRETLFVCDTITGLGDACISFATEILKVTDDWQAVGAAMKHQGKYIQLLKALQCHIIVFSHIRYMGGGGVTQVVDKFGKVSIKEVDSRVEGNAYPSALGQILPPQIGRHFNVQLEWKLIGSTRKVATIPDKKMALKIPFDVKAEMDAKTALVDIFAAYLER
jgi:hypothetical protein